MGIGSRPDFEDYAASDDYYARRARRNARDMDRAIEVSANVLGYLGITALWRRFSNWVLGPA